MQCWIMTNGTSSLIICKTIDSDRSILAWDIEEHCHCGKHKIRLKVLFLGISYFKAQKTHTELLVAMHGVKEGRNCWLGISGMWKSWGCQESWYGCGWGSKLGVGGAGMGDVCGGCGIGAGDGVVVGLGEKLVLGEGPRCNVC